MGSFSQRYGYTSAEKAFQREVVSPDLRTQLWNILKFSIWNKHGVHGTDTEKINWLVRRLWFDYFNNDLDSLPSFYRHGKGAYDVIKDYFFSCKWYEVYDFLEFLANDSSDVFSDGARKAVNSSLEKFNAAYRFVETNITEITDENEIESIEQALDNPHQPVRDHLKAALEKLSNKEKPDYRNSVKESISAVEAACRILTEKKTATLGDALKKIDNLHPALKQAFDKLYAFTCDASGVRHSLMSESNITYADAKFMLVTCSAFVSYLNTTAAE
ncbi:MAG: hypothetical protein U1E13_13625 [Methylophilaceae bacterium]|nr:hypothetical protein [Methylophilaceae bacterium]